MVEYWNIGKMGLELLQYQVDAKIGHADKI
jgi:hypothetical protein